MRLSATTGTEIFNPGDDHPILGYELIPVERTPWRYPNARVGRIAMRTSEPGTWLVGIKGIDEERYRAEEKQIKQGMREAVKHRVQGSSTVEWLRFIGSSSFRRYARVGDSLNTDMDSAQCKISFPSI